MSAAVYIYALCEPGTEEIRYIGSTSRKLSVRLREHLDNRNIGKQYHAARWLQTLVRGGLKPECLLLVTTTEDHRAEIEKSLIHSYRSSGYRLTNNTNGGEGTSGHKWSEESRKKLSRTRMEKGGFVPTRKGCVVSEATKKKQSESAKKRDGEGRRVKDPKGRYTRGDEA